MLADDEDDDITDKKEVKSKSKKGTEDASKEIEEDTFSDLLGSDHEDEFDNEDDDDDEDFDEIDGDEDATTPAVEVKKTRKEKVSKKIKDVKKTSSNSKVTKKIDEKVKKTVLPEKSLKRKLNVIEESSAAIEPLKKSKLETTEKKVPKVDKVTVKKASSKVLKK